MTTWTQRPWVPLAIVVLCAAALRVALLPTARFGGDEALFFRLGMDIVEGKSFPLLGTQITDGHARLFGPAFLYVMALPLLIFRGPEAQYLFTELAGAVGVGVFFLAMRRPFGVRAALFASLLMALSPWSALYADRTWNPHILLVVEVGALWCAIVLREDPKSRALIAFIPLCAVMPHFHMSAPVAWVGLGVLVLPTIRGWDRRALAIGLALAALCYAPLVVHELQLSGDGARFGNTRAFIAETVGPKAERHTWSFLWIPVYALRFLTLDVTYHELTGYWGGPDEWNCVRALWEGTAPRPFSPLRLAAFAASLALALWAITSAARTALARWRTERALPWFALAFGAALLANMALLGSSGKQVFGHYVTNLLPFVFVVYAAFAAALFGAPPTDTSTGTSAGPSVRTVSACALALAFCLGGVEATLAISRRVDGRIGLVVHRDTLARVRADGAREGNAGEPVRLDFGYRSGIYEWHHLAARDGGPPIRFDAKATARRYRLVEKHRPLREGTYREGPIDVGWALLYRL